jgi:DNA modification methylase
MSIRAIHGDCRDVLKTLPDESVHCVVTSPPFFGLRDYGVAGQIGLEATPDAYVAELVAVFREMRRVLRDDGTLWLNLGDSYAQSEVRHRNKESASSGLRMSAGKWSVGVAQTGRKLNHGLKPKDLLGIPWMVAFALRADGWYLRQDIIWSKPNPMPESVRDRCTKAHEYLFLLSKSPRYFYDAEAIAEDAVNIVGNARSFRGGGAYTQSQSFDNSSKAQRDTHGNAPNESGTRNRRSVWEVATAPFSEAHFATFPPALIEPCIKAGCTAKACSKCGRPWVREVERTAMVIDRSERTHELGHTRSSGTMLEPARAVTLGFSPSCSCNAATVPGVVLDPFSGAGTTGLVADRLGRDAILIELNEDYSGMSRRRITDDAPLFAEVLA